MFTYRNQQWILRTAMHTTFLSLPKSTLAVSTSALNDFHIFLIYHVIRELCFHRKTEHICLISLIIIKKKTSLFSTFILLSLWKIISDADTTTRSTLKHFSVDTVRCYDTSPCKSFSNKNTHYINIFILGYLCSKTSSEMSAKRG